MQPANVDAVLYDPKVAIIWDIIQEFFESNVVSTDVKLYTDIRPAKCGPDEWESGKSNALLRCRSPWKEFNIEPTP